MESTLTTADRAEVEDYAQQSLQFLDRAREYVTAGDLHQASEKAWGAAAHMAKAVAAAQGWEYDKHRYLSHFLNNAWQLTVKVFFFFCLGYDIDLHGNYYRRRRFLNAEAIAADIESVAELVELLAPLTE
ncbi:MAG: hypothetical protein F4088_07815 [Chloroflexi bacterium]|nr:hypothetical protein [Chloroflexota bacterium]